MKNKSYIIYKVTNKTNNKCYIGITNRGFKTRFSEHIFASNNIPKFKFHLALKKYGFEHFTTETLFENVESKEKANELEIELIQKYDSYKNGYNMTLGGGHRGEFKHNDESKSKLSKSHLGKILTQNQKNNISKALSGKPKSNDHRLKVIEANTGKKRSAEYNKKLSERMIGKFIGNKNPAAIIIYIYNHENNLIYKCHGNFELICKENGLPTKALRKSYYNNGKPIYTGKTIKKEVLIKNKEYINWFAIKL